MKRLALFLALAFVARADEPVVPSPGTADSFRQLAQILDALQQHYVAPDALKINERASMAFRQLVRSLDPEADLLSPSEYAAAKSVEEADVGLTLAARNGKIVVVSARDGSPAHHAGLMTGDEIRTSRPLCEVRASLRGPAGTTVQLNGQTLTRVLLTNVPPSSLKFLQYGVAYCRWAECAPAACDRLERDLTRVVRERARGLILDLRGNAGGSLDAALRAAKLFLPDKAEIVTLEFARPEQRVLFQSDTSPKFTGRVVLLVNAGTAAETELLAAALRDNGRARLVGSRTWGRGWNSGLVALPDGWALQIPTTHYMPPSKKSFQGTGLMPDVPVEISREAERGLSRAGFGSVLKTDRVLARALELLAP